MEIINLDNGKIDELISVNAYVIASEKVPSPSPKTIFDLSPKAQSELIKSINSKELKSEDLTFKIASELTLKKNDKVSIIDYTLQEKKIIIPIRNKSQNPADRISKLIVSLKLDASSSFKIISCNKIETQYQSYDLGKLNYTEANQAELTASLGFENSIGVSGSSSRKNTSSTSQKAASAGFEDTSSNIAEHILTDGLTEASKVNQGLSGKLSATRSLAEEVLLKQRIVALNAMILEDGKTLSIYQDGVSGIDLTGNVIVTIILENKSNVKVERVHSFGGLFVDEKPNDPDKVQVREMSVFYPNLNENLKSKLSFEGDFRAVVKRGRTISEADDKVEFKSGKSVEKDISLLPKDQFKPLLWSIYLPGAGNSGKLPIKINNGALVFSSFSEALDFTNWLQQKADSIKGKTLGDKKSTIYFPHNSEVNTTNAQNLEIGFF